MPGPCAISPYGTRLMESGTEGMDSILGVVAWWPGWPFFFGGVGFPEPSDFFVG